MHCVSLNRFDSLVAKRLDHEFEHYEQSTIWAVGGLARLV